MKLGIRELGIAVDNLLFLIRVFYIPNFVSWL